MSSHRFGSRLQRLLPALTPFAIVLALVAPSQRAQACSPPIQGFGIDGAAARIPANGTLPVFLYCSDCAQNEPYELVVETTDGTVVPGSELESLVDAGQGWAVWLPATPLEVGRRYRMRLVSEKASDYSSFEFEAIEPMPDSFTLRTPNMKAEAYVEFEGEPLCCGDSLLNSCGAVSCFEFPERGEHRILVDADWEVLEHDDYDQLKQFAYQGRFFNANSDQTLDWFPGPFVSFRFQQPSDRYCYEIRARRFTTGQEWVVAEGCVAGSDVAMPKIASAIAEERDWGLRQCTVPPAGLESQWCDAYAEEVERGRCDNDNTACEAALSECTSASPSTAASCQLAPPRLAFSWLTVGWLAFPALAASRRRRRAP